MEVIKNEAVAQKPVVDREKLAQLQEKFDLMNQQVLAKEYTFSLNVEQTDFLMEIFFNEVEWKGYESYAISETHKVIAAQVKKGKIEGKTKAEIVEAIFHFLKNFSSKGHSNAANHKSVCDQFALPMNEINQDRQNLRDLSLEIVSVEQGIPIEDVIKSLNEQYQQQQ